MVAINFYVFQTYTTLLVGNVIKPGFHRERPISIMFLKIPNIVLFSYGSIVHFKLIQGQ